MNDRDPDLLPDLLQEGEEAPPPGVRIMAFVRWALLLAMALLAAYTVTFALRTPRREAAQETSTAQPAHPKYHCPMHRQEISDEPGPCPICGMVMVPILDNAVPAPSDAAKEGPGEVSGLVSLRLSQERIQESGVVIDAARREALAPALSAFGQITADESRLSKIYVRFSGYVEELFVADQGAWVRKGQPLAAIFSDELLRLESELLDAKKWGGELARPIRERMKLLGVADQEIAQIEAAGKISRDLAVRSPSSGYVVALGVRQGDRVDPDRELFEVADLSRVWLVADVYQRDIGRIRKGLAATLTLDAYPGQAFTGRVDYVYPALDAQLRTLPVRIAFANPGGKLKPGMFGKVAIALPASAGITVPAEAVIDTGDRRYLFVETSSGHFTPRQVTVGEPAGDRVQITEGIAEGERVAAAGNFFLDAESRLRASIAAEPAPATSPSAPPPPGSGPSCEADFDRAAAPEKYAQCKACERVHRGMGTMEADCKNAIPKPWRQP